MSIYRTDLWYHRSLKVKLYHLQYPTDQNQRYCADLSLHNKVESVYYILMTKTVLPKSLLLIILSDNSTSFMSIIQCDCPSSYGFKFDRYRSLLQFAICSYLTNYQRFLNNTSNHLSSSTDRPWYLFPDKKCGSGTNQLFLIRQWLSWSWFNHTHTTFDG